MRFVDEYRSNEKVQTLLEAIRKKVTRPWYIMEICGGQTHAIARYRLEEMLPPDLQLLHGPGCPVCVTPVETIDYALKLATQPNVILASFGDMMRVPGSKEDLLSVKARGADIRMLYTPLDALSLAEENPDKEIVFFAIGFETTAPVHLMALKEAIRRGLPNFSILTSLFTVPPAIEAILSDPESKVDGFLTAGHVCAITGNRAYHRLTARYKIPMVVTGFEPVDLLYGIYRCISQLEAGSYEVENAYKRAVPEQGNAAARQLMDEMLEPCDQDWRGIGIIPSSGLQLRSEYKRYSSRMRFQLRPEENRIASECIAGLIMRGLRQPSDCPHFGKACHPTHPLGAPQAEFAYYIQRCPFSTKTYAGDFMQEIYDFFIRDIVTTAERKNLETKHPEIPHLMQEYRDGILLFEVSNREIWSKPSAQQKVLEAKWIADLNKKYPVTVNWKLLKKLKK